jgi:hypothetical protein
MVILQNLLRRFSMLVVQRYYLILINELKFGNIELGDKILFNK